MTKKGGAISVTSIISRDTPTLWLRGAAISPTIVTLCINGLKKKEEGYVLLLGVDLNHSTMSGDEFGQFCSLLSRVLSKPDVEKFYPLLD